MAHPTCAVVGLGPMGLTHASIANARGSYSVAALVDSDSQLIRAARKLLPHVRTFTDTGQMMRTVSPTIVYVCTPPQTHFELVRQVLGNGSPKAVFVEKPLATSLEDVSSLNQMSLAGGVAGRVGFQRRFNGVFQKLRELVSSGSLGQISLVRARDFSRGPLGRARGWRSDADSGGAVLEWGIHLFDLMLWIFGTPTHIQASRHRLLSDAVEDYALVTATFPHCNHASIEIGWNMRNFDPPELVIEIYGSDVVLVANDDVLVSYGAKDAPGGLFGRTPTVVEHVASLTPTPPFLLGQVEYCLQDIALESDAESRTERVSTFAESVTLQKLLDSIRGAPLS